MRRCQGHLPGRPLDAQLYAHLLALRGYRTVVAQNLAEARTVLGTLSPLVVVLDIGLPDGSGWDLLQYLRATGHALPIVVVSGIVDEQPGDRERIHKFMRKPVNPGSFLDVINELAAPAGGVESPEDDRIRKARSRILGSSESIKRAVEDATRDGKGKHPVLLTGETGTGSHDLPCVARQRSRAQSRGGIRR